MSEFLREWSQAIEAARKANCSVALLTAEARRPGEIMMPADHCPPSIMSARTMHPSFMGGTVPKHDPERDRNKLSIQHEAERER